LKPIKFYIKLVPGFTNPPECLANAVTGKVVERQSVKLIDLPTGPTVLELQQGNSGKPRTCRFVLMMRFEA
jgi:hypothetical protein